MEWFSLSLRDVLYIIFTGFLIYINYKNQKINEKSQTINSQNKEINKNNQEINKKNQEINLANKEINMQNSIINLYNHKREKERRLAKVQVLNNIIRRISSHLNRYKKNEGSGYVINKILVDNFLRDLERRQTRLTSIDYENILEPAYVTSVEEILDRLDEVLKDIEKWKINPINNLEINDNGLSTRCAKLHENLQEFESKLKKELK